MASLNELSHKIESAIRSHSAECSVGNEVELSDIQYCVRWIMRDNPDIFWYDHQYSFDSSKHHITFKYTFSPERCRIIMTSIDDVVRNDFGIDHVKSLPQVQQIVYVYKWLVTYCNYNADSAYNQSIYSVFVRRNSVCTGYAKAAHYLFKMLGIESRLVFGRLNNDVNGGRHCWNIVKLDGHYYHFDSCLGDSVLDDIIRKSGGQDPCKCEEINCDFVLLSTEGISRTRSIEDSEELPDCSYSMDLTTVRTLMNAPVWTRMDARGCLLENNGSTADIFLCAKDKNVVLKAFRGDNKEYVKEYMTVRRLEGLPHLIQYDKRYTDLDKRIIAFEQAVPLVDLLCSFYYEFTLKKALKMAHDIALAWEECKSRGILYRDLHICNVYRSNNLLFKLGDFGGCTDDFHERGKVGNQWFMAPETLANGTFTESSAVYSISMILYFVLNNLRPAFFRSEGTEDDALRIRMSGEKLPVPAACEHLPERAVVNLMRFLHSNANVHLKNRERDMRSFLMALRNLNTALAGIDCVICKKGISLDFDLEEGNKYRINKSSEFISRADAHRYAMGDQEWKPSCIVPKPMEDGCSKPRIPKTSEAMARPSSANVVAYGNESPASYFPKVNSGKSFSVNGILPPPSKDKYDYQINNLKEDIEQAERDAYRKMNTMHMKMAEIQKSIDSMHGIMKLFQQKKYAELCSRLEQMKTEAAMFKEQNDDNIYEMRKQMADLVCRKRRHYGTNVYSSVFAPAEVKPESHLRVQLYLHTFKESEYVSYMAAKVDKDTKIMDYLPLQMPLLEGENVDVVFKVYGETCLYTDKKSLTWLGNMTKCSFSFFVPTGYNFNDIKCELNVMLGGALIGEMLFVTKVVETPRNLNTEILSHPASRIFISYAHKDAKMVRFLALAYKALGVNYFYDRDSLQCGDVYEEKIFESIDSSTLFILCWSQNAAQSEYVAKERLRAMERAYPKVSREKATLKILPVSIEPYADLPEDMLKIYNFEMF